MARCRRSSRPRGRAAPLLGRGRAAVLLGRAAPWLVLPLLLGGPVCQSETNTMDPTLQHLHSDDPVEPVHAGRPLRDVPAAAAPAPAIDPTGGGSPRRHGSARQHGRAGVDVVVGPWHAAWSVPLDPAATPEAVLAAHDRIVVQALAQWSLHDPSGAHLRTVARVAGDVVIDPDARQVFYADPKGFLAAARLHDGEVDLRVEVQFGAGYSRTLVWRSGRALGVHGRQLPQMTHEPAPTPDHTVLEVIDLGDPLEKDDVMFVTSSRKLAGMSSHAVPLLVAASGDAMVLAAPGRVYRADARLAVLDELVADFEPVAMSLDEGGLVHLVARAEGKAALWVLDAAAGERRASALLPGDPTGTPPLVGWDHRVFVLLETGVAALEPDGRAAWTVSTAAPPAGAVITRGGVLVVTTGSQVLMIEPDGRSRVALDVGEAITTAPTLVSGTELLVATHGRLVGGRAGARP